MLGIWTQVPIPAGQMFGSWAIFPSPRHTYLGTYILLHFTFIYEYLKNLLEFLPFTEGTIYLYKPLANPMTDMIWLEIHKTLYSIELAAWWERGPVPPGLWAERTLCSHHLLECTLWLAHPFFCLSLWQSPYQACALEDWSQARCSGSRVGTRFGSGAN